MVLFYHDSSVLVIPNSNSHQMTINIDPYDDDPVCFWVCINLGPCLFSQKVFYTLVKHAYLQFKCEGSDSLLTKNLTILK